MRRRSQYLASNTHVSLLILNLTALAIYFAFASQMGFPGSLSSSPLLLIDAQSYFAAGAELLGIPYTFEPYDALRNRPFLFPLIISALYTAGPLYFWLFQLFCWLLIVNGIFIGALRYTQSHAIGILLAIAVAGNAGLVGISLHALSEIMSLALLSLFCLIQSSSRPKINKLLALTAVASLLIVVRPVFIFLVGMMLFLVLYQVIRSPKLLLRPWFIPLLILALSPLLTQWLIIWTHYNEIFISEIGRATFRNHIVAQVVQEYAGLDLATAREKVWLMENSDMMGFLWENLGITLKVYFYNVFDSFWDYSYFVNYPEYNNYLTKYSLLWNQAFYLCLTVCFLFLLTRIFRHRLWEDEGLLFLLFISAFLVFSAGFGFEEGDRLSMTAIFTNILIIAKTLQYYRYERKQ